MSVTVYVSIGNSDDKLTQRRWCEFTNELWATMDHHTTQIYGEWYSLPNWPFQNACIAGAVPDDSIDLLRADLHALRELYNQDSIAWVAGETEFI